MGISRLRNFAVITFHVPDKPAELTVSTVYASWLGLLFVIQTAWDIRFDDKGTAHGEKISQT
jgi:hypothetical protein